MTNDELRQLLAEFLLSQKKQPQPAKPAVRWEPLIEPALWLIISAEVAYCLYHLFLKTWF